MTTKIIQQTGEKMQHGHKAVGTTSAALTGVSRSDFGVLVKAAAGNAGTVYVGGSSVTADSNEGTGGFPLAAGDAITIPIKDPTALWVIASEASQDVAWMVI